MQPPAPGTVDVWEVDLTPEPTMEDEACLSAEESERAMRFAFARDRRRYVASHAALRRILAAYVGTAPHALAFRSGAHGKPQLAGPGPAFNLSHGGDVALVAVAACGEIGVDVESPAQRPGLRDLAAAVFTPVEIESLAGLADHRFERAFLTAWTRKESALKAVGLGLAREPRLVHVGTETTRRRVCLGDGEPPPEVDVVSIAAQASWIGAVASLAPLGDVALRRWGAKGERSVTGSPDCKSKGPT